MTSVGSQRHRGGDSPIYLHVRSEFSRKFFFGKTLFVFRISISHILSLVLTGNFFGTPNNKLYIIEFS